MNIKYKFPIAIGFLSLMAVSCQNTKEEQKRKSRLQKPTLLNQFWRITTQKFQPKY